MYCRMGGNKKINLYSISSCINGYYAKVVKVTIVAECQ
uniref:Uncharacterized protein n=1 Tax=Anguilla anguilla TaxID=7936 RepID=A0A0E9RY39_ANGAN